MRLVTFSYAGRRRAGAVTGDRVVDLALAHAARLAADGVAAAADVAAALVPPSLRAILARGDAGLDAVRAAIEYAEVMAGGDADSARRGGIVLELAEVALEPVIPDPEKILCLGRNYGKHAAEAGMQLPKAPEVFGKYANSLLGAEAPIAIPRTTSEVDYEAELAVVIGRRGRYIPEDAALDHVAGYTCFNDVSARDYQMRTSQWTLGKAFDGFAPLGPWLVTADEVDDPHGLRISCRVSGETLQDANTSDLIFNVPKVISYISEALTLEPGDVIATGTPEGVGFVRQPPRFLRPGDVVEVDIERIGVLRNPVVAER